MRHATRLARITLPQISGACGLPLMTVSRALRGRTKEVNAKDLTLAVDTARQLGYRPNLMNHALRTGRRQLFGLVSPGPDTYLHKLLAGAHDAWLAAETLMGLELLPADGAPETAMATGLQASHDRQVDGLLLIASAGSPQMAATLPTALLVRVPVVVVDAQGTTAGGGQIELDLTSVAQELGTRLAKRGIRHLVVLTGTAHRYAPLATALGTISKVRTVSAGSAGSAGSLMVTLGPVGIPTTEVVTALLAQHPGPVAIATTDPGLLPLLAHFKSAPQATHPTLMTASIAAPIELLASFHPDELLVTDPYAHGQAAGDLLVGLAYQHHPPGRRILIYPR